MKNIFNSLVIIFIIISIFFIHLDRVDSRIKDIYYDNFRYTDNVIFNKEFDYKVNLNRVGDYYEIIFDVVNENDVDYKLSDLDLNKNNEYFSYELTYLDNSKVMIGDKLKNNSIVTLKYRVNYNKQIDLEEYEFNNKINLKYIQNL